MLYAIPDLDINHLQKVQNVEKATGLRLLALNALKAVPAKIQDDVLDNIQALENELGLTLVAVR
jgi:hypothetical protein